MDSNHHYTYLSGEFYPKFISQGPGKSLLDFVFIGRSGLEILTIKLPGEKVKIL
jgi:hypothetical protein